MPPVRVEVMRVPLTLLAIIALAAAAWGQAGVPGGFALGVPQNAIGNAGPSPPAGCGNGQMDFSDATGCNTTEYFVLLH